MSTETLESSTSGAARSTPNPNGGGQDQPHRGGRGRSAQGRGQERGGRGRQNNGGRGRGDGPTQIAPTSGVPYGHVPGYLPGSSSLVEELDQRVQIVLRDGRHLVGMLRSFDQFSNMVLAEASERKVHQDADGVRYFSDVPLGVYIVRGDSMVMMGQIGPEDTGMKHVEAEELEKMIRSSEASALEWDFDKDLFS